MLSAPNKRSINIISTIIILVSSKRPTNILKG